MSAALKQRSAEVLCATVPGKTFWLFIGRQFIASHFTAAKNTSDGMAMMFFNER